MFHVASRRAPEPLNLSSAHHAYPVEQKLNIPRLLARPAFSEPSRDALARLDKGLAGVPLDYVKKILASKASDMILARPRRARLPDPHLRHPLLPRVLRVHAHRRLLRDRASLPASATVPLYPASALVMAAHCALLPPLPRSHPHAPRRAGLTLPIVPLTVPSPETFALLHAYLHTLRPDTLLAALLPALAGALPTLAASGPSSAAGERAYVGQFTSDRLVRLAHSLAGAAFQRGGSSQAAMASLMAHIKVVNGLWQNVCALGVFDDELWGVMDLAWEVVLAAMTKVMENKA
ncbi:uncharacterized protein BXZ73DRAFT_102229 [Epithele typhae]|uniref:uncharacterized protein n=1 Tax=Epithele typhae TaxID=378194 RepID=UPI0020071EDC|nr:uncharacterized protein BXZ73DRAFT_102229 [Epithele typhae]KAH9929075.1 hypothetical protein BXZ73DRAFT_102229 [Epithele typhae]